MSEEALREACNRVGGQTALARALKLKSQGSISGWIARGRVPAERVVEVEGVSGVPRFKLRPDLYTPAPQSGTKKRAGR